MGILGILENNMKMKIQNAKIKSTMLGLEDHNIMTIYLNLDYGSTRQSFGGYQIDKPLEDINGVIVGRMGTAFGCEFIRKVLEVVDVRCWEDLPGKHIRVEREDEWNGKILRIGNIIKDKWFDPKKLAKNMEGHEKS